MTKRVRTYRYQGYTVAWTPAAIGNQTQQAIIAVALGETTPRPMSSSALAGLVTSVPRSRRYRMSQQSPVRPASEVEPNSVATDAGEHDEVEESGSLLLSHYIPSWLTSFGLHVSVIIVLGLIPILVHETKKTVNLMSGDHGPAVDIPSDINLDPLGDTTDALLEQSATDVSDPTLQPITDAPQLENITEQLALSEILNPGTGGLEANADIMGAPASGGNEFSARAEAGRGEAARRAGANGPSEEAVALGLQWLAAHQLEDGSWNFNHQIGPGDRSSPNPGQYDDCPIAATAMCLMAFLGNGQTQIEGTYKDQVRRGLNYLIKSQRRVNEIAGSLVDSNNQAGMYSHGLATIALAEAYGMTKDSTLHDPAQAALGFIAYAQADNGGWRYRVKESGDLSVSGWILMGIKSGLMSDLEVPKNVTRKSARFLDAVGTFDSGAKYCYRPGNQDPSANMTAVGLLCRMYMGWKHDHPALERGVKYLARGGPQVGESTNMYFNYYAAQVLRQYGGPEWEKWNVEMRDFLVKSQSRDGATKGSWLFDAGSDPGPAAGGRMYCTAMAVMTLEVYYRFLPIYRDAAMADEFPLD